jgi:hypothetical protein
MTATVVSSAIVGSLGDASGDGVVAEAATDDDAVRDGIGSVPPQAKTEHATTAPIQKARDGAVKC